jgi:hypothetical protein
MLQLSFAAGDLACATHDSGSSSPKHQHTSAAASAATAIHHSADGVDSSKSCEVPARSDCCAALASCGPSIGIAATIQAEEIASIDVNTDSHTFDTPASLTTSPEPPPPKA